ncbi:MAG: HAD family hydrolase [Dehalococcoidia bacterium]|nr:HAD family hydrolase [Dehalococcoidia bacterium]
MTYRAVLFDWGGTIVRDDSVTPEAVARAVVQCIATETGVSVAVPAFVEALRAAIPRYVPGVTTTAPRLDAILAATLRSLELPPSPALVEAAAVSFCAADAAGQRVYDDARALLGSLRYRGYAMALVTNSLFPARLFAARVAALGFAGYFGAIVTSSDAGHGKPHPAPYRAALDTLAVEPSDALFVGDREDTDVAGARALGMTALRVDRRTGGIDRERCVIGSLTGVHEWLGEGMPG